VLFRSLVLRNNLWELPWSNGGQIQSGRVVNNIGYADWSGSCQDGVKYSHNVFTVKKCGSTDKVAAGAMGQVLGDFRLKPGAAAIDAGDPNDHPALDALGNLRVAGRAPDAGPFEFGSHPPGGSGGGKGSSPAKKHGPRWGRVLKVLDGRTLRVRLKGGRKLKVRLAGIAGAGKKRCGPSPRAKLAFLAPKGSRVKITFRTGGPSRDRHGHRLAYVRRKGRDVGHRLVAHGASRFNGNTRLSHQLAYKVAQKQARSRRLGLWGC